MIKLQPSIITIMFLCAMTTISSTSKYHGHVVENTNIQTAEVVVELDSNQYEQGFQDQQDTSRKIQNKTSKYIGVTWHKDNKKWRAQLKHEGKDYYGGLFDNEKDAAMKVNLLCDKYEIERKHPISNMDVIKKIRNTTSKYTGVGWKKDKKCWQVQFHHNKKRYYGGYFDNEEHAAMKINLLCDKYEIKRWHPTINIDLYISNRVQRDKNQTSKYNGVCWHKDHKCWQVQLAHNKKQYFGGNFDYEEHAAMKVNLLCDKYEIERKNSMINLDLDAIQKEVPNKTSIYNGVYWHKHCRKWTAKLIHQTKPYYGGLFDIEEHAAMKINLICDTIKIKRKNPHISKNVISNKTKSKVHQCSTENTVNEEVKIEDKNIFDRFKDECENRCIQSNDATEFQNSNAKRKRKQNSLINDDVKEEVKEENELLEKIQQDYTKMQD